MFPGCVFAVRIGVGFRAMATAGREKVGGWGMEEGEGAVCLFSDTVADVNGVARFLRTLASTASDRGKSLHVITSQRFECPDAWNVHNVKPVYARAMPGTRLRRMTADNYHEFAHE